MNKKYLFSFLFLLTFLWACRKCPTQDMLQGTWTEQETQTPSKLVFDGTTLYFFHSTIIDTFSYELDKKHSDMMLTKVHHPEQGTNTYALAYHKKKEILTVVGLFPAPFGQTSETNYKK